jgi:palmitoyltransferase ZDHHC9/14/18
MQVVPEHMAAEVSGLRHQSSTKVWQAWPGNHMFCCDGRCMVGPDIGVTAFAAALTTAASAGFWIFVGPTLPLVFSIVSALLYALTMTFMILTATTDPGIVPR